jgi:hypothetical protein
MLKPSEDAPEEEHIAITGILRIYKEKKSYKCESVLASETGKYEEMRLVSSLSELYNDCHDENDEEANILVAFIKANSKKVEIAAAKKVASWYGVAFETLFPAYTNKKKESDRGAKPRQEEVNISSSCEVDHDTPGNYVLVDSSYYFGIGQKYSEAQCRECKKYFPTQTNQTKKRDVGELRLPSSRGNAAFVCKHYELDICSCGNILCTTCNCEKTDTSTRTRRCKA